MRNDFEQMDILSFSAFPNMRHSMTVSSVSSDNFTSIVVFDSFYSPLLDEENYKEQDGSNTTQQPVTLTPQSMALLQGSFLIM